MPLIRTAPMLMLAIVLAALPVGCTGGDQARDAASPSASGTVEAGLRVLTLEPGAADQALTIYRGDYVRFEMADGSTFQLEIPTRETSRTFPAAEGEKPYVKFPDAGEFAFTAGDASGVITALEFRAASYREVGGKEAAEYIANVQPLILDVRTEPEFLSGHIAGAELIPVQVFQQRMSMLRGREADPVFVYCRSGNRSTVAAKMLVDAGFEQVVNLRRGIKDWTRAGLPVE